VRPSIIVDIDGTIADCGHRLHHINGFKNDVEATHKADWDAFHAETGNDSPIEPTCQMVRELYSAGWKIIMITGRSDSCRGDTVAWLEENRIGFDLLLMRKRGDHSQDQEIKRAWLHDLRVGRIHLPHMEPPRIVIEDRSRVVKMWREEGLIALQCDTGDF